MSPPTSPATPDPEPMLSDQLPTGPIWRLPGVLALVFLSIAGFGGYAALISVAPLWVVRGGASEAGAGAVTTVLLLLTVATQSFVPRLLARFGHAAVLSAGLVFLAVPSLAMGLSSDLVPVLVLSAVRGIGFGILTVTGSAVIPDLAPPSRRGEAIGAYGLGVAVPNLVILPLSVAITERFGFWWAFGAGAMPLLGIPAAIALGRAVRRQVAGRAEPAEPVRLAPADRRRALLRLLRPAAVLLAVTLAGGALMTFLPQMTSSGITSAIALFVLGATAAFSRWWIGGVADRRGAGPLMIPLLIIGAIGMAGLALAVRQDLTWLLMVAVAAVGCAYGALQNITLLAAFDQVERPQYGTASAVWNIGFDSGMAFGAMVLGVVASQAGFSPGLAVLAVIMVIALPLAWSLAHSSREARSSR